MKRKSDGYSMRKEQLEDAVSFITLIFNLLELYNNMYLYYLIYLHLYYLIKASLNRISSYLYFQETKVTLNIG